MGKRRRKLISLAVAGAVALTAISSCAADNYLAQYANECKVRVEIRLRGSTIAGKAASYCPKGPPESIKQVVTLQLQDGTILAGPITDFSLPPAKFSQSLEYRLYAACVTGMSEMVDHITGVDQSGTPFDLSPTATLNVEKCP